MTERPSPIADPITSSSSMSSSASVILVAKSGVAARNSGMSIAGWAWISVTPGASLARASRIASAVVPSERERHHSVRGDDAALVCERSKREADATLLFQSWQSYR